MLLQHFPKLGLAGDRSKKADHTVSLSSMVGRKLGSYEVVEKLGEGGMGEVWRARDARLNRSVAVKVLPAGMADDPARRQRFEQEARALAALNHPNVVAVYDVGQSDGQAYLVSELVDGESLRKLIERGPVSGRKLIDIAVQSAEGIAAAHSLGIIHRDLKPENIMLTRDGRVKVLDFGLAKQNLAGGEEAATVLLSQPGMVFGTVGYMSPEQVRGEPVDARSDLFSLGCVIYELTAGRRPFEGKSVADTMSAILTQDPEPLSGPPALDAIVRRCVEKDPARRFQSASDLAFALRSLSGTSGSVMTPAVVAQRRWPRWMLWPVSGLAVLILLVLGYYAGTRRSLPPPKFQRITFREGRVSSARFAPDGHSVLYSANWDGGPNRVYWAAPGNPESLDLGFGDASLLSISSKGDAAFLVGPFLPDGSGTLSRNSISGGQPRQLLEHVLLADWSPDGSELAVVRRVEGKNRLEYPVGNVLFETVWGPFNIRVSPDGRLVAFTTYDNGSSIAVYSVDRNGGKPKRLGVVSGQTTSVEASSLCWTHDGKEIWFRSFDTSDWNTIHAIGLSGKQRVAARFPGRVALFDIAADGRMLFSSDTGRMGIRALSPGAAEERDASILDAAQLRGISEDGSVLLANTSGESGGAKGSIYFRRLDGSAPVRLGDGVAFALSPEGKWLTGYSSRDVSLRKFILMPTGPGETLEITIPSLGRGAIVGWLGSDETYLVEGMLPNEKSWRFFSWNRRTGELRPLTPEIPDGFPVVSPDRRHFMTSCGDSEWCFYSTESGGRMDVECLTPHDRPIGWRADNQSVYVMTHHDQNGTMPISIIDIQTGQRTPWKVLRPPMAVDEVSNPFITPDGRAYAYNFTYVRSQLYLGEGVR
jgi:serine/threonine protein kinase/Tol biopolymer transport system component